MPPRPTTPASSSLRGPKWSRLSAAGSSPHLDVFPEAEAVGDLFHFGKRRLVEPRGARVALAVDDHVVELDAVRAFQIGGGLRRLLQPLRMHSGARVVL